MDGVQIPSLIVVAALVLLPAALFWWVARERERRRALAERERREHAAVLDSATEGIYVVDARGRCTFINRAGADLLGWPAEELLGERMHALTHHTSADGVPYLEAECPIERARGSGGAARGEDERFWRRDGTAFPVAWACAPLRGDAGEDRGAVVVFSDISERKRAEAERAELLRREREARAVAEDAERWSRFLVEAGEELAATLDYRETLRRIARLCVPRLADLCAVDMVGPDGALHRLAVAHTDPSKERLARELADRLRPSPDAPAGPAHVARTGVPELAAEIDEEDIRRVAASAEHAELLGALGIRSAVCVPLKGRDRVHGVLTFAGGPARRAYTEQDLTRAEDLARRAALAVENAQLYAAARQAARTREEVLSVVSHDLRNPLNAIVMAADVIGLHLDDPDAGETARRQLTIVHQAVRQARRLIDDLLDVGKIEAGRLTLSPRSIAVPRLLSEALELGQPHALERAITLELQPVDGAPPVHADPDRVLQVFANLVGNAIKFTPSGGSVRLRAAYAGSGFVRFEVEDTGPGIREADLPRLFDAFWQGPNADRGGAGLGLAICRGIVEAHGGTIGAENAAGGGARFYFTLPSAPAAAAPATERADEFA